MKLLLDQGLPRSTGDYLGELGIEASHVAEKDLSTASDSTILRFGREEQMVVVTLDADFHSLLALSGASGPSVIRIRIEGLRGERIARLLFDVLRVSSNDLMKGAMISVTDSGIRVRMLPVSD